jgi:hypothetical protein
MIMLRTTYLMLLASWFAANPVFAQETQPIRIIRDGTETPIREYPAASALDPMTKGKAVYFDTVGPGNLVLKQLDDVMEKGAFIGVSTSPVPAALRDQLQLRPGIGLVVDHVTPDGPADKAGVKVSDVIEKLDDQLLVNNQQLAVLVRTHKVGEQVKLSVIRAAKPQVVKVTIGEGDVQPLEDLVGGSDRHVKLSRLIKSNEPYAAVGGGGGMKGVAAGDFAPLFRSRDASFTLSWSDKEHQFTITQDAGGRQLLARDKAGKQLFNGPIDTFEQLEKLPPEFREKVKKLDAKWRQGAATQPVATRPRADGI